MVYDPKNPQYGQPVYPQSGYPQPQPGVPYPGYTHDPAQAVPVSGYPGGAPSNNAGVTLPTVHPIDESLIKQSYTQHKEVMQTWGGPKPNFLAFLGPHGQKRWDQSVHVNYECAITVYLAPPWGPGKNIFCQNKSHFWKSMQKPQGTSITCGNESCLVCKAREAALNSHDDALKQRALMASVRTRFLYNCFVLDNLKGHYDPAGVLRPFILQAGSKLHAAIGDMLEARGGALHIVDPTMGRPLRLKKRKTGPLEQNVEYTLVDLNQMPLPTEFYPGLENLWNLEDMEKAPTQEEMIVAVNEMGLPMPGMEQIGSPGGQFSSGMRQPQPAYPNPYGQPPKGAPGYPGSVQGGPVQAPMQEWAAQRGPEQPAPVFASPPAVHSTGAQSQYRPQPGQAQTQGGQSVPGAPAAYPQPQGAYPPPPTGFTQPPNVGQVQGQRADGRDRCFGKHDPSSNMCVECPPDLKPTCIAQSGSAAGKQGETVEQLQARLYG